MNAKEFSIYMITCLATSKGYVGITSRTVLQRWKVHCRDAKKGQGYYLHAAIRKHGKDQFSIRTLATASSWNDACALECAAIAEHQTFGERGYNLTTGGEGAMGREKSTATRALLSASAKNQWAGGDGRARMVESLKVGWSDPDARARLKAALIEASGRPEVKARRSAAMKKRMADTKEQVRMAAKKRANRPEAVAQQSERMKQHWQDPVAMAGQVAAMKRVWADPEKKEKMREAMRLAWVTRKARAAAGKGAQT